MARPQRHIVAPAITWEKRCTLAKGRKFTPVLARRTTPNIVAMVAVLNTRATNSTLKKLFFAAGYISMGIKGSHGPKTKMTNSVHGVMVERLLPLWT